MVRRKGASNGGVEKSLTSSNVDVVSASSLSSSSISSSSTPNSCRRKRARNPPSPPPLLPPQVALGCTSALLTPRPIPTASATPEHNPYMTKTGHSYADHLLVHRLSKTLPPASLSLPQANLVSTESLNQYAPTGSCQFASLACALSHRPIDSSRLDLTLRSLAVNRIRSNPHIYQPFLLNPGKRTRGSGGIGGTGVDLMDYCKGMADERTDGDAVTMQAICDELHMMVLVLEEGGGIVTRVQPRNPGEGNVAPRTVALVKVGDEAHWRYLRCVGGLTDEEKRVIEGRLRGDTLGTVDDDDDKCPVCFETTPDPVYTRCGHMFCSDCLDEWCDKNRRRTCPVCKSDIGPAKGGKRVQGGKYDMPFESRVVGMANGGTPGRVRANGLSPSRRFSHLSPHRSPERSTSGQMQQEEQEDTVELAWAAMRAAQRASQSPAPRSPNPRTPRSKTNASSKTSTPKSETPSKKRQAQQEIRETPRQRRPRLRPSPLRRSSREKKGVEKINVAQF